MPVQNVESLTRVLPPTSPPPKQGPAGDGGASSEEHTHHQAVTGILRYHRGREARAHRRGRQSKQECEPRPDMRSIERRCRTMG